MTDEAKKSRQMKPYISEFGFSRKEAALACLLSFVEAGRNPSLRESGEGEGGARYWVSIEEEPLPECERYPRWSQEPSAIGFAVRHALEAEEER